MSNKVFNVLFLCTCNSARSLLAEAQLNALGQGRFHAFSAGSFPRGQVNPLVIDFLRSANIPTEGLRSKSWNEFAEPNAPVMDFVLTICDDAKEDQCPIWPGQPVTTHWHVDDPAAIVGDDVAKHHAIVAAAVDLRKRIELLVALPDSALERVNLSHSLAKINQA